MSNGVSAQPLTASQTRKYTRLAGRGYDQALIQSKQADVQHGRHLIQICDPLLSLILSLPQLECLGDVPTLYAQLQSEHHALYHAAALAGIDQQDVELAAFALVAFADERIAESDGIDRAQWPFLQYECFKTRRAGEQFFEQLQQIQGNTYDYAIWKDPARAQMLEVYYLCLLLGFRGAWAFDPPLRVQHELEQIQRHARSRPIGPLAPNGGPRSYRNFLHGTAMSWMWLAILVQVMLIGGLLMIHVQ